MVFTTKAHKTIQSQARKEQVASTIETLTIIQQKKLKLSSQKKNVLIIGDSQLRHIDGAKLSNDHVNVTVQPLPGAKIARMKNANCTKADVVIVHADTCNQKKESDPEELASEIVSTMSHIKSSCNKTQIAFSGIIKRKDDLELNAKAIKTNELVIESSCTVDLTSLTTIR